MDTNNVRQNDNAAYNQKLGFLIATPPLVVEMSLSTQVTEVLGSLSSVVRSELLSDFATWFTNAAKL